MNKRTTGFVFLSLAAFLYAARYWTAAIYISNMQNHGREWFVRAMQSVGPGLHVWALIALIIGAVYFISSEWNKTRGQKSGRDSVQETPGLPPSDFSNCVLSDDKKISSQTIVNFALRGDL